MTEQNNLTTNAGRHAEVAPVLNADDPLIDMSFITTFTGMSDKWFYKLIQEGRFPKPIKLGSCSRWKRSEVEIWFAERIKCSRGE